jgi:hypothetical protein
VISTLLAETAASLTLDRALSVAVVTLAGCIVHLWRRMLTEFAECKKDRDILRNMILKQAANTCGVRHCEEREPLPNPFESKTEKPA